MSARGVQRQDLGVPLSKSLARFNVRVTNKVTRPFAGWLPGFGVVQHVGRTSGRAYETPVNVFRRGAKADKLVVALTYGADSEWVKNVMAAGGAAIRMRGATVGVTDPVLVTDPERQGIPVPARWMLGALDVTEFLSLTPGERPTH